jgi:hypothetical protein
MYESDDEDIYTYTHSNDAKVKEESLQRQIMYIDICQQNVSLGN